MVEKVRLEIPVVLPVGNECERCVDRLQEALLTHKGVMKAHVVPAPAPMMGEGLQAQHPSPQDGPACACTTTPT